MSNILVNQLTGNTTDTTIEVFAGHAADSTTRTNLEQGLAKSWLNLNGTGTIAIQDSLNIASVADSGTGRYDPSFTNAMNTANYSSALGTNGGHILTENHAVHETGKFYLSCGNSTFGSFVDHGSVHVQINGDLA